MPANRHEYIEGTKAQENFEEGIKLLFKGPKDEVVKAERKAKRKRRVAHPLRFLQRVGIPEIEQ